jgi:hypothetical protein
MSTVEQIFQLPVIYLLQTFVSEYEMQEGVTTYLTFIDNLAKFVRLSYLKSPFSDSNTC